MRADIHTDGEMDVPVGAGQAKAADFGLVHILCHRNRANEAGQLFDPLFAGYFAPLQWRLTRATDSQKDDPGIGVLENNPVERPRRVLKNA